MSKLVKDLITKELESRYHSIDNAVWVELLRVDGITTNLFRRDLNERQMRLEVVKTSLLRRAVAGGPLEPLARELEGPAALITGGDSAIEVAKLLQDWKKKFPKGSFRLRGALLEGEFMDEQRVESLHKMPTKQDMQAKLVSIILAPASNVVGAAVGPARRVAGCVKDLADKLEKGEEIKKTA